MKIQKLKKKYNNPNLIFYDIETITNDKGILIFNLGVVTCENFSFICYDSESLTDTILNLTEKRNQNFVIAHNAQFDFSLLYHNDFDNFELTNFSTQPFIIGFQYGDMNRNVTTITFIDSLSFFKNSLDEIGKIFGKEKITIDILRNKFNTEIEEYCKQDTIIVQDIMNFINNQCIKYDIPFPVTFAQMSYMIYRKHFLNTTIITTEIIDLIKLERDSYFGGRVEGFNFQKHENTKVYDINSLYPSVMHDNFFPISPQLYYSPEICLGNQINIMQFLQDELESKSLIIAKVVVKISKCYISPIPLRINGKLIFPIGEFETTLCTPELELIKDNIIEVKELIKYSKEKIFSNYVDTFYNERMKHDKKSPFYLFYKLLMNSLYGKFGQRRYEFKRFKELDGILDYGFTDLAINDNEELIKIHFWNSKAYRKDIYFDNPRAFVPIASFVCSYARVKLYQSLIKQKDNIIYCDTDSMIVKNEIKNLDVGNKLGQWKEENDYTNFQVLGNKHYISDQERKIKGVPKTATIISEQEFEFEKITKLKESIIRFKSPQPHLIKVNKKYSKNYDKRKILKNGKTIPLEIQLKSQTITF